jgi:hypothetical protein
MKHGIKKISLLLMILLASLLPVRAQKAPSVPTQQTALPGGQPPTVLDAGARVNPMKIAELKRS